MYVKYYRNIESDELVQLQLKVPSILVVEGIPPNLPHQPTNRLLISAPCGQHESILSEYPPF